MVSGVTCVVGTTSDVNCQSFTNNICTQCYGGYFIGKNGNCLQVNPLCRTINPGSGACTSCYPGYEVSNSNCIPAVTKDKNCKKFDNNNQNFCVECYVGYLASKGKCIVQNPLCKTLDFNSGACLSCWSGYTLDKANCVVSQAASPSADPYCINYNNGVCTQCSAGYYYHGRDIICKQLDPLCKTSDMSNGNCQSCYPGYSLNQLWKCEVAQVIQIANCNTVQNGVCTECLPGYWSNNGQCSAVSILCASYDSMNGQCTSCVDKHYLQNGECVYPAIWDDNCINYTNAYCSLCKPGLYLSIPSYTCQYIDPSCTRFNY